MVIFIIPDFHSQNHTTSSQIKCVSVCVLLTVADVYFMCKEVLPLNLKCKPQIITAYNVSISWHFPTLAFYNFRN